LVYASGTSATCASIGGRGGVLIGSVFLDLTKLEMVAVVIAIMFVLLAELINSAVEQW